MGPSLARKVGMSDLYLSEQFQDVVSASMQAKGLRKGLVQSGFVLAKVKLAAASKATAKAVQAKVEAQVNQKMQALARKDQAMEQCLAIAAVGINRRFFKNTDNELKASLETEFQRLGVRGAGNVIRAMFAQHGVSYAKAILTLANKISAMPEDVRNQYAEALDLTNDEDFDVDAGLDEDDEVEDDDVEEIPTSVTAALVTPARRQTAALLKAGVKTTAAMSILSGDSSLV
jgi:AraC-like DNA-binding protein